jgi:hypothetical protein
LFVRQLVRHLDETGAADLDEAGIPQAVQDVIGRRLSQLDHSTVRALTVAAVIGSRFRLDAVTDAAGLNREEVLAGMEQALTARLLSELPSEVGCFAFVHDLVRKALYDGLSRSRRAVLHRQVAEALETLPQTAASELARHFQAAAAPAVRDKAIRYAIAAAQQAEAQLAHEEAVIHYRAALSALQASGGTHLGERGTLHLALGAAQARAGDPAARESYLRAVNDARADGDSDLFVRAVLGLCAAWGPTPVVDEVRVALVDEALEAVGDEDTAAQARLLARLAAELRFHPDPTRCHRLSAQAVEVARRAGDVATLADCLDAHLAATWGPDGASDRLAGAREIIRLAGPDRERAVAGHAWGIIAACDRCDIDLFDTELAAYRALAEELRQPRYLYYLASRQAMRAILAGDLDEGWRLAEHCREIGQRAGESDVELVSAAIRAPLWIERPDPAAQAAFAQIAAMLRTAAPHAQTCLHSVQVVEIVLALAVGDTQRARTGLADFPAATIHREPKDWKWLFVMANLARAAARLNDMPRAVLLADLLEPYAAQGVHWAGGVAFWGVTAHWLGLLATTLRRWEAAEHHLTRAVEVHDRMGAHPWTARSQYELAQCLFGRCRPGDHSRAATLLKTARRTAATLGLRTLTREITQLATR